MTTKEMLEVYKEIKNTPFSTTYSEEELADLKSIVKDYKQGFKGFYQKYSNPAWQEEFLGTNYDYEYYFGICCLMSIDKEGDCLAEIADSDIELAFKFYKFVLSR